MNGQIISKYVPILLKIKKIRFIFGYVMKVNDGSVISNGMNINKMYNDDNIANINDNHTINSNNNENISNATNIYNNNIYQKERINNISSHEFMGKQEQYVRITLGSWIVRTENKILKNKNSLKWEDLDFSILMTSENILYGGEILIEMINTNISSNNTIISSNDTIVSSCKIIISGVLGT